MAFLSIPNVSIVGVSSAVPSKIEQNSSFFNDGSIASKFINSTGVRQRHVSNKDICTSDLCLAAAEKLIVELDWNKKDIEALIFVSQTGDYGIPSTAPILQDRLGLSIDCYTLEISLGCTGWIYGITTLASLMQNGSIKKGLLLVGDTISKVCSKEDNSTYPLFGDAGTATALEYKDGVVGFKCDMHTKGEDYRAIIIEDSGYRNPVSSESFIRKEKGINIKSNKLELEQDGMSIFSFGINKAPKCINNLCDHFSLDKESIDFFTFHQANRFMLEKIRKKLKVLAEKVPYSMDDFGNTSSASIPITLGERLRVDLTTKRLKHITCGFGVGLSWGSLYFETENIIVPKITII